MYRSARMCSIIVGATMGIAPRLSAQRSVASDTRSSAEVKDNTALTRPITVSLDGVSLREALRAISAAARDRGVFIQYQVHLVNPVQKSVTLHAVKVSLGTVLERVLLGTKLQAVPSNAGVTIVPVDSAERIAEGGIRGVVTDATTKRPLAGATITIDGKKVVARTDEHGVFVVASIPAKTYTLTVRRLGYQVAQRSVVVINDIVFPVEIELDAAATPLDEVVTTVTGPQRRAELGNVVTVIHADSLVKEAPITSLSQLLTARVPGLVVSQGQGTVGGNIRLQIRSASSLSLSTEPIVIVDGIRYTSKASTLNDNREEVSPLNDLNPNDIETVEVVKGPSASTLYGTDASNGVIVVTTKRGKAGPPRWNVYATQMRDEIPRPGGQIDDSYYGYGTWHWDIYSGETDHCDLYARSIDYCVLDSVVVKKASTAGREYSMLRPSQSWTSGVSVSGGPASLRYFFSGTYNDQTAAVSAPDTVLKIMRARGGKLPESFTRPNGQTLLNLLANISATVGPSIDLVLRSGYTHGRTRSVDAYFTPLANTIGNADNTDLIIRDALNAFSRRSIEANDRYVGGVSATARAASWLTAKASVGMDRSTRNLDELHPRDSMRTEDRTGRAILGRNQQTAGTVDGGLTATAQLGWLSARTSIGSQYTRTEEDGVLSTGTDLPASASTFVYARDQYTVYGHNETVTLGSYLEEVFGVNGRLFFTPAIRVDGASGFGSGYKAASYPKFGVSWNISQEPLFPSIPGVTELRVRASSGVAGRQAAPEWSLPYLETIPLPNETVQALRVATLGNAKMRPERSRETEIGVDADLFSQRIVLGTTWWRRRTTDGIISLQDAPGFNSKMTNIGLMTGKGFEGEITARLIDTRPLSFSATATHSKQESMVVHLGDAAPLKSDRGGYAEGYPVGVRFIQRLIGYSDADGNGILTVNELQYSDTLQYAGVNEPTWMQTLALNAGLFQRRLRFSATFDRRGGNTLEVMGYGNCDRCRENFDSTVTMAERAAFLAGYPFQPIAVTTTRLREMSANVIFPNRLARTLRIENGSFLLAVRNLAQWTNYSSNDPESVVIGKWDRSDRSFARGIPQSRTWTFRFDLGL